MADFEDLPQISGLSAEEQDKFIADMKSLNRGEIPEAPMWTPVNPHDMNERQKLLFGLMARGLRKHKERKDGTQGIF